MDGELAGEMSRGRGVSCQIAKRRFGLRLAIGVIGPAEQGLPARLMGVRAEHERSKAIGAGAANIRHAERLAAIAVHGPSRQHLGQSHDIGLCIAPSAPSVCSSSTSRARFSFRSRSRLRPCREFGPTDAVLSR